MERDDAAATLIEDMMRGFDELASQAGSHENKPRIYFEVSPLIYGLWTAGSGTFMNEIATLLGAENVFADVDGWAGISEEQVIPPHRRRPSSAARRRSRKSSPAPAGPRWPRCGKSAY